MANQTETHDAAMLTVRLLTDKQHGLSALAQKLLDLERKIDFILARLPNSPPGAR